MLHYTNTSLKNIRNEKWVDIKGYENLYQVSSMGRIKSLPRFHSITPNGGEQFTKLKILKQNSCSSGMYLKVNLYKEKIQYTAMVHLLVAKAFIDNKFKKPEINHKNTIKYDNRKQNLEWCTSKENSEHALLYHIKRYKLTKENILFIRNSSLSKNELSKLFNVCLSYIYRIKNKKAWACIKQEPLVA